MKSGEIIRGYGLADKVSMSDFAKKSDISKPYVPLLEADTNSNGGISLAGDG